MADMELVIKIPEEEYQNYLNMRPAYPEGVFCYIKAIQKGKLLPKGHGRLIDADDIRVIELEDSLHIIRHEKGDEIDVYIDAPTIIEADNGDGNTWYDIPADEMSESQLREQTRWIPVSEKLPKENEYIGNIRKYYLIQDEYGDMQVAHLSKIGWIPMGSLKAIGNEVTAWMPLPKSYKAERSDKE